MEEAGKDGMADEDQTIKTMEMGEEVQSRRGIMEEEDSEMVDEEEGLAIAEVEEDFKIVAKEEEIEAAIVDEEEIEAVEEENAPTANGVAEEEALCAAEVDITTGDGG